MWCDDVDSSLVRSSWSEILPLGELEMYERFVGVILGWAVGLIYI